MRRSIALLTALVAGFMFETQTALAQVNGVDSGPVFESDLRKQAEQEEAERASRRKTYEPTVYPRFMEGGERPDIQPAAPPIVYFDQPEQAGSIIVDTQNRKLYFMLPGKKAYAYPISVGRDGFTWSGTEKISRIAEWPSWTPPPEMRQRIPGLPVTVSGGMKNPHGARALYLGNTVYRIHGTNNDRTVGRANSSGCFRLTNENVIHLASIAKVGTTVKVLPSYNGGVSENAPLSSLFGFMSPEEEPAHKTKPKTAAQSKKPAAMPAAAVAASATGAPAVSAAPSAVPAAAKQTVATTDTNAAPAPAVSAAPSVVAAPAANSPAAPATTDAQSAAVAAAKAAAQAARTAATEAAAAAQAAKSAAAAAKQAAQ